MTDQALAQKGWRASYERCSFASQVRWQRQVDWRRAVEMHLKITSATRPSKRGVPLRP